MEGNEAGQGEQPTASMASAELVSRNPLVPRNYQGALIALAEERNIIACLPTGAGKTLIALKLSEKYYKEVKTEKLKIVFVACTLPLLKQQYELFKKYTLFECNAFSGSGSETFDTSSQKRFHEKFKTCEVILMTPQYLYNLLTGSFIQFEDMCLLILDECHHAAGSGHPMHRIMTMYTELKEKNTEYPLPRVLGLTATVVMKNINVEVLPEAIASVERRLDCIAVSSSTLQDVLAHSTSAEAECVRYSLTSPCIRGYNEDEYLAPIISAAKFLRSLPLEFKFDARHKLVHPMQPGRWLFNGKGVCPDLATLLEECCLLSPMLGPYAVIHLAVIKINYLKDKIRCISEDDDCTLKMYRVALTALIHFIIRAKVSFPMAFTNGNIDHLLSNKVIKVLEILLQYRDKTDTEDELCGLLFVSRRTIAISLKEILMHLKTADPFRYSFICPAVIIGANARSKIGCSDRIKPKDQAEIINRFRAKDLNLLICTSVLEEGLDVPSCNLVLRFDPVVNFTSFIQSMGRARKPGAKYFVLLGSEEYDTGAAQIAKFNRINRELNSELQKHYEDIQNGIEEDDLDELEDEEDEISLYVPDFCPEGPLMARVTAYTCVSLCHRYANAIRANKINCWNWFDQYTEVQQLREVNKIQASIKLPPGSAVDNLIIQCDPMPNKKIAKKAVFMEACKKIHAGGGFDRNFLPIVPEDASLSSLRTAVAKLRV